MLRSDQAAEKPQGRGRPESLEFMKRMALLITGGVFSVPRLNLGRRIACRVGRTGVIIRIASVGDNRMIRSWTIGLLSSAAFVSATFAQSPAPAQPIFAKVHFQIHRNGSWGGDVISRMDPTAIAAIITAGCAAYGVDCSSTAPTVTKLVKSLGPYHSDGGNEHRGIYRAPPGYEMCTAKIDWGDTGISGKSTFSATLYRDPRNKGLGYYADVPRTNKGEGIDSDLYFEFVPADQLAQRTDCFPSGAHLWNCRGQWCPDKPAMSTGYGIYRPARWSPPTHHP
jgi:hypothetical protein